MQNVVDKEKPGCSILKKPSQKIIESFHVTTVCSNARNESEYELKSG